MRFSERQRLLMGTNLARDRAEALLTELLDASRAVQIHNVVKSHPVMDCDDSLDRAINATRELVKSLNDSLEQAEADVHDARLLHLDLPAEPHYVDDEVFELDEWLEDIEIDLVTQIGEHGLTINRTGSREPASGAVDHSGNISASSNRTDPAPEVDG